MLKKSLIGLGVVVAVFALALIAIVLFVDVNRFKPQIEAYVKDNYKRTLKIDGDLKLAVFPRIAVALPRTTVSNQAGDRVAASLDSARVSVGLFPLLQGNIEVDRVSVSGLKATIERRRDGSTSIDDIIKRESAPTPDPTPAGATREFRVDGIDLAEAELVLNDLKSGASYTLSRMHLKTGSIAPQGRTPVDFATNFSLSQPKAEGEASLRGTLDVDLERNVFGAADLAGSVKAKLEGALYDAALKVGKVAFGEAGADNIGAEKISLAVKLGGATTGNVKLAVDALTGTMQQFSIGKLDVDANVQQGARRIVAALSSPASGSIEGQSVQLAKLGGEVSIDDPALPQKSVKLPIAGTLSVDAKKQVVDLQFGTKFDDTSLSAKLGVSDFDRPALRADLQADQFNLDRYFPPEKSKPKDKQAKPDKPGAGADRIDLSGLKNLRLNAEARIGQLQARGVKASNVRLVTKVAGGRIDIAPMAAQLYGGSLAGTASATGDNRVAVDATLANVAINPLMKDALDQDLLEGRGNVKLNVTTGGDTVDAMKNALDGKAALALRDGAIKGINIAQKVRDARAVLSGGSTSSGRVDAAEKTDFSELTASFQIDDGVARSNDLDAKSPLLRLGGSGLVDIGKGQLDYTARVSVVGSLKGQDGREMTELRGVTVPVRLHGSFDNLAYSVDWSAMAQDALKSRVAEQIEKKLAPQVDEQKQKLEERARNALKGLLQR